LSFGDFLTIVPGQYHKSATVFLGAFLTPHIRYWHTAESSFGRRGLEAIRCGGPWAVARRKNPHITRSASDEASTRPARRILEQGEALKRSLFLAIATIALVAAPRVSQAQLGLKPFSLGIAGGATQPMSDLKNGVDMGYNATAALGINVPLIPVGLRIDGAYNQFGAKEGIAGKLRVVSATGNVVWRLPSVVISPYLIGGAGIYMSAVTGLTTKTETSNNFGWNAGAGLNLPLSVFHAFVEARYNRVKSDTGTGHMEFVPVTFGLMF
jgi:hypothetical protein